MERLTFDDASATLHVALRGSGAARGVRASDVAALFGGRIRHESVTTTATGGGISLGKLAVTAATGIPVGVSKSASRQTIAGEELHHALALCVAGVGQVWYLLAASFNFRRALGADATYASETNVRLFVKRLAAFAPQASRDEYVSAVVANAPLPPPLDSLLGFLRSASARM